MKTGIAFAKVAQSEGDIIKTSDPICSVVVNHDSLQWDPISDGVVYEGRLYYMDGLSAPGHDIRILRMRSIPDPPDGSDEVTEAEFWYDDRMIGVLAMREGYSLSAFFMTDKEESGMPHDGLKEAKELPMTNCVERHAIVVSHNGVEIGNMKLDVSRHKGETRIHTDFQLDLLSIADKYYCGEREEEEGPAYYVAITKDAPIGEPDSTAIAVVSFKVKGMTLEVHKEVARNEGYELRCDVVYRSTESGSLN